MKKPLSRRTFLAGMSTATVALTVLQGCEEGEKLSCNTAEALSDLSDDERKARKQAQYVESTKIAAKNCENCTHYEPPAAKNQCGGCKVIEGPVNPEGYCNLWAEKAG